VLVDNDDVTIEDGDVMVDGGDLPSLMGQTLFSCGGCTQK